MDGQRENSIPTTKFAGDIITDDIQDQGFSYLSEVGGQGPVDFVKKAFESSKLRKFDAVYKN